MKFEAFIYLPNRLGKRVNATFTAFNIGLYIAGVLIVVYI